MYHLKDHKINSVTSLLYGKSPCDGVGGTIKRETVKASLQVTITNQIFTTQSFYMKKT